MEEYDEEEGEGEEEAEEEEEEEEEEEGRRTKMDDYINARNGRMGRKKKMG